MNTIADNKALTGTWQDGRILLDEPADWPEGCRVLVTPQESQETEWLGITEEQWPRTPEALVEWLEWLDSIEPIEMTPEEEADLLAWRQKLRDLELASFSKRIEGLFE
ncbi:MAG: hypothetical protein ACLQGP_04575 [Isosphaeraceae bacterium]